MDEILMALGATLVIITLILGIFNLLEVIQEREQYPQVETAPAVQQLQPAMFI